MRKEEAERILEGYLKPVLGFTLKRCKSSEDAENLSRMIILKACRVLLVRDDVEDAGKFIRTVAHIALCNYCRSVPKNVIGIWVSTVWEAVFIIISSTPMKATSMICIAIERWLGTMYRVACFDMPSQS